MFKKVSLVGLIVWLLVIGTFGYAGKVELNCEIGDAIFRDLRLPVIGGFGHVGIYCCSQSDKNKVSIGIENPYPIQIDNSDFKYSMIQGNGICMLLGCEGQSEKHGANGMEQEVKGVGFKADSKEQKAEAKEQPEIQIKEETDISKPKLYEKKIEEDLSEKTKIIRYPMPKMFSVFNLNQIEETDVLETPALTNPVERIDQLIQATGAKILYGRQAAYFRYNSDEIYLPQPKSFRSIDDYYATLLHELVHWTGHKNRLNRSDTWVSKKESAYAGEELVAELGSAFLCAEFGIKGEGQHASYIDSWLEMFRGDKRTIFKAATLAQQAFDYLISLQR